jgi:FkbM family methyltransferase
MNFIKVKLHLIVSRALTLLPASGIRNHRLRRIRQAGLRHKFQDYTQDGLFFAQYGQDRYVWEKLLCSSQASGVFVDIGAYDGITFSNTAYFERSLGWSGILVEPNPDAWKKAHASRQSTVINCGVGENDATLEFIQCGPGAEMLSCFREFTSHEHLARIETMRQAEGLTTQAIMVPLRAITSILEEHAVKAIDFLSIDVEGAEFRILEIFPFDRVPVKICAVEANCDPVELEDLMISRGFRLDAIVGTDHIYLNRNKSGAAPAGRRERNKTQVQ